MIPVNSARSQSGPSLIRRECCWKLLYLQDFTGTGDTDAWHRTCVYTLSTTPVAGRKHADPKILVRHNRHHCIARRFVCDGACTRNGYGRDRLWPKRCRSARLGEGADFFRSAHRYPLRSQASEQIAFERGRLRQDVPEARIRLGAGGRRKNLYAEGRLASSGPAGGGAGNCVWHVGGEYYPRAVSRIPEPLKICGSD